MMTGPVRSFVQRRSRNPTSLTPVCVVLPARAGASEMGGDGLEPPTPSV